jgi:asparagine synthetase B (glutamine-hydrolysing)
VCGISGLVSLDGELSENLSAAIRPMTDRLYHRGPDGAGYFQAPWVALGHRRLAIIDPSAIPTYYVSRARLFEEHRDGRADHSDVLWAVWMLERWARHEPAAA